jgi:hypothetical protein
LMDEILMSVRSKLKKSIIWSMWIVQIT